MRTSLCIAGHHHTCGGVVNRGITERPVLDGCSCSCHQTKTRAHPSLLPADIRKQVLERDGYRCQANIEGVCTGAPDHVHHRVSRSRGGSDEMENLVVLCAGDADSGKIGCHRWAHNHPEEARRMGLIA